MKKVNGFFKQVILFVRNIVKKLVYLAKESPKTLGAWLSGLNGLLQLAISQTYILALVTIKPTTANTTGVPSTGIGMYFFAFILFGLISIFTATRINNIKSLIFAALSNLLTIGFGFYFLLQITNPSTYITYRHVSESVIYLYIGLATYLLGIIFYMLHIRKYKGKEVIIDED